MRCLMTMLATVLVAGSALQAQDTVPIKSSLDKSRQYLQKSLLAMAEKMPEEHYSFKPVPEVRTFGELVAHVADHQAVFCSMSMGERKNLNGAAKKTKAELVAALRESIAMCDAAYGAFTDANATGIVFRSERATSSRFDLLTGDLGHSWEEYGYMSVYLRLKGIVPPTSDPEFRKSLR